MNERRIQISESVAAETGIDEAMIERAFGGYIDQFAIQREKRG